MTQTPTPAAAEKIEERQDDGSIDIARRRANEAQRVERKLGLLLVAPAVTIMLAVAAYPIIYAFYLSLQRYDLRFPQLTHFVGFANYGVVLSSGVWWHAFFVTLIIMVISVAVELVLGMALALMLYYTPLWRGLVRVARRARAVQRGGWARQLMMLPPPRE